MLRDMNKKKLFNIVSNVFEIPESEINYDTSPETIEKWDSFNGLILLDEIENSFDVKFTLDEILDVKKVLDFKNLLEKRGITIE